MTIHVNTVLVDNLLFQVLSWFCNHGDEICRHDKVADNLKGIQVQQKDFEKLYFSAMVSSVLITSFSVTEWNSNL